MPNSQRSREAAERVQIVHLADVLIDRGRVGERHVGVDVGGGLVPAPVDFMCAAIGARLDVAFSRGEAVCFRRRARMRLRIARTLGQLMDRAARRPFFVLMLEHFELTIVAFGELVMLTHLRRPFFMLMLEHFAAKECTKNPSGAAMSIFTASERSARLWPGPGARIFRPDKSPPNAAANARASKFMRQPQQGAGAATTPRRRRH